MSHITKKDLEELAEFWDTHDITDFEFELEEVKETVFEEGKEMSNPSNNNLKDRIDRIKLINRKKFL